MIEVRELECAMEMEAERRIFLAEGAVVFRFDRKAGKLRVSWANARKIHIFATGKTLTKEPGKKRWDMGNVRTEEEVG